MVSFEKQVALMVPGTCMIARVEKQTQSFVRSILDRMAGRSDQKKAPKFEPSKAPRVRDRYPPGERLFSDLSAASENQLGDAPSSGRICLEHCLRRGQMQPQRQCESRSSLSPLPVVVLPDTEQHPSRLSGVAGCLVIDPTNGQGFTQARAVQPLSGVELLAVRADLIRFRKLSRVLQLALCYQALAFPVRFELSGLAVRILLLVLFLIRVQRLRVAGLTHKRNLLFILADRQCFGILGQPL